MFRQFCPDGGFLARHRRRRKTLRGQPIHKGLGSAGQPGDPGSTTETERASLRMTLDVLGIETAPFRRLVRERHGVDRVRARLPGAATPSFISSFGEEVTEDDLAVFIGAAGLASST